MSATDPQIAEWIYKAMDKPPFMLAKGEHPLSDFVEEEDDEAYEPFASYIVKAVMDKGYLPLTQEELLGE